MASSPAATDAPASSANPAPVEQANTATNVDAPLVPEDFEDDDSASERGESVASSSTSVADSILSYRIENGRTYHGFKEGKYLWPNDARENERLDIQHHMLLLSFDGQLGTAPPNRKDESGGAGPVKVGRVLDIGTGTGIWAMEFGEEHPESEVLGVDLSASQPDFAPPNVRFEIDDVEEPWLYSRPFDYIHSRNMNGSIRNWRKHIQNAFDFLNPDGYFEITECDFKAKSDDGTLKDDSAIIKLLKMWGDASAALGHPFQDIEPLADIMREVGFVDVQVKMERWPSNPWPRDRKHKMLGHWNHENFSAGLEGFMMAPLTRGSEWTKEEVMIFAAQVRKEMRDPHIHYYTPLYSMYGRKPAKTTES